MIFSRILVIFISCHLLVTTVAGASNPGFDSLVTESKAVLSTNSKTNYHERLTVLLQKVRDLSDLDKKNLYEFVSKKIDMHDENLSSRRGELLLVGAILAAIQDEDFIAEILIKTPPPQVGFFPLGDFLQKLPGKVLARVIQDRAVGR